MSDKQRWQKFMPVLEKYAWYIRISIIEIIFLLIISIGIVIFGEEIMLGIYAEIVFGFLIAIIFERNVLDELEKELPEPAWKLILELLMPSLPFLGIALLAIPLLFTNTADLLGNVTVELFGVFVSIVFIIITFKAKEVQKFILNALNAGSHAESLTLDYLNAKAVENKKQGYDGIGDDGKRYEIKYASQKRSFITLMNFDFDIVVLTELNDDVTQLEEVWEMPVETAKELFRQNRQGRFNLSVKRFKENSVKARLDLRQGAGGKYDN